MVDDQVNFLAKYGKWMVVKKMQITSDTNDIDVALFLASLTETFERKVDDFLKGSLDFKDIDKYLDELVSGKARKEAAFAPILAGLASPKLSKLINAAVGALGLTVTKQDKAKDKALKQYCKVYCYRTALTKAGLQLDYSAVAKLARKA